MTFRNTFFLLALVSQHCLAQQNEESNLTNVTTVTFWSPGISCEKRIGKFQSLYGHAFMNLFIFSDGPGYIDPALTLHYRYYYNYSKRTAAGKRADMNSLNYISPVFEALYTRANGKCAFRY